MSTSGSPDERFGDELRSLVQQAAGNGVSASAIEERLQVEAQRVRERLRVKRAFVYECPDADCGSSYAHLIDRETVTCDDCHEPLLLVESRELADGRLLRFACADESHTTRSYTLDRGTVRCSVHDEQMRLTESYPAEEGSSGADRV